MEVRYLLSLITPGTPQQLLEGQSNDSYAAWQITWYNDYNAKIVEVISPHFEALGRADVTAWIASKTQKVEVSQSLWLGLVNICISGSNPVDHSAAYSSSISILSASTSRSCLL